MDLAESASESGEFDEKMISNVVDVGSDNDVDGLIGKIKRNIAHFSPSAFVSPFHCAFLDSDEPTGQNFSTESCALPKVLDGTYYKVCSPVSYTYTVKATCLTCNREVAGSIRSTGNFFSHMDKKHPDRAENCRAYCQSKTRKSSDMKILKIRRPLTKPIGGAMIRQVKIEASMRRPKILDGKYFELVKKWTNGKIAATCRFCRRNVCAHISHTGNLFTHIRVKHHQYMEECKMYCNSISTERKTAPSKWEVNHEQVNQIILLSFVCEMRPILKADKFF